MRPYYNLPAEQRRVQHVVTEFNANERLWRSLERKRLLRRKLHARLPASIENSSTCSILTLRARRKTVSVCFRPVISTFREFSKCGGVRRVFSNSRLKTSLGALLACF